MRPFGAVKLVMFGRVVVEQLDSCFSFNICSPPHLGPEQRNLEARCLPGRRRCWPEHKPMAGQPSCETNNISINTIPPQWCQGPLISKRLLVYAKQHHDVCAA